MHASLCLPKVSNGCDHTQNRRLTPTSEQRFQPLFWLTSHELLGTLLSSRALIILPNLLRLSANCAAILHDKDKKLRLATDWARNKITLVPTHSVLFFSATNFIHLLLFRYSSPLQHSHNNLDKKSSGKTPFNMFHRVVQITQAS